MALDLLEEFGGHETSAAHLEPLPLGAAEAAFANAPPALPPGWPPPALASAPKSVHWGVDHESADAALRDAGAPRPATAPGAQIVSSYAPPLPPRPESHDGAVLAAREAEYAAALSGLMSEQPAAAVAQPLPARAPAPPPPPPRPPTPADDRATAFHGAPSYGAGPSTTITGWAGAASSQSGGGGGGGSGDAAHPATTDDASWWAAPGLRHALRAVRRPRSAPGPAHAQQAADGPSIRRRRAAAAATLSDSHAAHRVRRL